MKVVRREGFICASKPPYMDQQVWDKGLNTMAAWRRAIELSLGDEDSANLRSIAQSRSEPASRVERARILLAYRDDPSLFAVGRRLGLHHQTVQRCVERRRGRALAGRQRLGVRERYQTVAYIAGREDVEFIP